MSIRFDFCGNPYSAVLVALAMAAFTVVTVRADDKTEAASKAPTKLRVYVGTYTGANSTDSKGIYRLDLDLVKGELSEPKLAAEVTNPSFLALHPTRKFLYAVGEIDQFDGKKAGAVSALAVDPATGDLKLLNQQQSGGAGPCHLTVDSTGQNVLVANYSGGSAGVLPIGADGKLGEMTSFVQHAGTGGDPKRQTGPHAHSVNLAPDNRFAMVADLGLDKVLVYKFDPVKHTITANDPPAGIVPPASGPRHFAFHPNGKYAYVINEMAMTVTAFSYNAKAGTLTELQTISTLPADAKGNNFSTAEVQVHPSGRFLYGSNRGHNSIAIFAIDPETGKLTAAGHQGTGIKTPRNFGVDPTGAFVIVANQEGDSLLLFKVDQKAGALEPTGKPVAVPKPVCVKFVVPN